MEVIWHPFARLELFEASAFYEGEAAGLGRAFLRAAEEQIQRMTLFPRTGKVVFRRTRRCLLGRFPYDIIYRCDAGGGEEVLFVLAVAHQKRRPLYWVART